MRQNNYKMFLTIGRKKTSIPFSNECTELNFLDGKHTQQHSAYWQMLPRGKRNSLCLKDINRECEYCINLRMDTEKLTSV